MQGKSNVPWRSNTGLTCVWTLRRVIQRKTWTLKLNTQFLSLIWDITAYDETCREQECNDSLKYITDLYMSQHINNTFRHTQILFKDMSVKPCVRYKSGWKKNLVTLVQWFHAGNGLLSVTSYLAHASRYTLQTLETDEINACNFTVHILIHSYYANNGLQDEY